MIDWKGSRRKWKQPISRYYTGILLEGQRNYGKFRIVSEPAELRTGHP
jgi:hypothetical protein